MILRFKDTRLEEIYIGRLPKRFDPVLAKKIRKVLVFLEAAVDTRDIRAYKALHLESLDGNLSGFHSVRIVGTGQRILFRVKSPELLEVHLENYH
ncbi:MAG: type II toxin-antitoxin system RelE/ParE family toxin [Alkalispirochaeta sp.]